MKRTHAAAAWLALAVSSLVTFSTPSAGPEPAGSSAAPRTPPAVPDRESRAAFVDHHRPTQAVGHEARAVHDEYDVQHYDISLSMDIPAHVLFGTVIMEARVEVPDLTEMPIDLFDNMTIDGLLVNGFPRGFTRADDVVTISLGAARQPGDIVTVAITYHGTPAFPGNPLPFRWNTHAGVPMILSYSEPFGGPAWWAQKDDPKDKATFALHYEVPEGFVAVSNGVLESTVVNGDGTVTYNWRTNYLMSPYLFSIAVTNFQSWGEVYTALDGTTTMDVTYWVYPEDFADSQIGFGRNIEMMEYFASIFGEYPFLEEKYGIAEFQHPGAMEHQTCTSLGNNWVRPDDTRDWVIAHELAHSWVGDLITMREWSHAWTKEGFATYCEALYFQNVHGTPYYHDYMAGMNVFTYSGTRIFDPTNPLDSAIYYKGAWVLHMLRHVVGDATFFEAIRAYVDDPQFRFGVSDTEDLKGVFETAFGSDLDWFFDEWVYDVGHPIYRVDWAAAPASGTGFEVTVTLDQIQTSGPIFRMPIDIDIVTSLGTERFVVTDSLASQTFVLTTTGTPQNVIVDPEVWIIREVVDVVGVTGGFAAQVRPAVRAVPNPFGSGGTKLEIALPLGGSVRVVIYDIGGRVLRTLPLDDGAGGTRSLWWDGNDAAGQPAPPGVYYLRVSTSAGDVAKRLVHAP
jgi:aminopeptidase N